MTKPVVGFAGMTHLGLCSAAGAVERGFACVAFDPDAALVDRLRAGALPVSEPDLARIVGSAGARLEFASDAARLARCDLVYVAPDVATDDSGRSDTSVLEKLLAIVDSHARPEACRVVLSQVAPGFTRRWARGRANAFYQVETLIFGRAIERATRPERFIVGCPDPARPLPAPLAAFLSAFECPVLPMRYESAELAKISINFCLVASVTVANTLAELCERIGADWREIAPALKLDRRIGPYSYLAPGLGLAGGNLERDLATVAELAARAGTEAGIVGAWRANSAHRRDWPLDVLRAELLANDASARVAVLGLAYKENTHSTKNSAALALLRGLAGRDVAVFDPLVPASVSPIPVHAARDPLDCAKGAHAVVLMTPWPAFRDIDVGELARAMAGRLVVDPYGLLDENACRAAGLSHRVLGVGRQAPDASGE